MKERLRRALAAPRPSAPPLDDPELRRAAVLVLLLERGEPAVVLTLRSAELRAHAGQWSFPGGRIDAADADPIAAALREAEEEIGVDPSAVEVLGLLDEALTSTGYAVTPVVAWLSPPPASFRPNPAEVAEVLEAPISHLDRIEVVGEAVRFGQTRNIYSVTIDGRTIWGATARILVELRALTLLIPLA